MSQLIGVALATALAASGLRAQQRVLPDRLAPATRTTLERLIDSASVGGVPRDLLYDKVSEGVLKGADDERIVRAVRTLSRELGEARTVLGASASLSLVSAAASALHAGVPAADIKRITTSAGATADVTAATTALVTLVDLVAKRVSVALATSSVQQLVNQKASDRQFSDLRSGVEQDILAGRSPDAAVSARIRLQTGKP
jgi:hypothetical protein